MSTHNGNGPREHRRRHHRQRVRRPRHRDPPASGGDRGLRRAREGRRRRRHLAREHVPGHRVRRALAPVLVLVRAEPRLVADVLARAPRSSATCSAARATSGSSRTCASAIASRGATWDDADARAGTCRPIGARSSREVVVAAPGPLHDPTLPDVPGIETFEGAMFHSATLGPRRRPARQARRRHRHRRLVDPVRPGDPAEVGRAAPLPAHGAVGRCRASTTRSRGAMRRLYRAFPQAQAAMRGWIYATREAAVMGFMHPRVMALPQTLAMSHLERQVADPGLRARLTPELHDRLQARADLQRLVPGDHTAERRRRRRRPGRGPPADRSSAPTASRSRSTRSSSAPASAR